MLKTELKYQLLMPENFKETQQCFAEHQGKGSGSNRMPQMYGICDTR